MSNKSARKKTSDKKGAKRAENRKRGPQQGASTGSKKKPNPTFAEGDQVLGGTEKPRMNGVGTTKPKLPRHTRTEPTTSNTTTAASDKESPPTKSKSQIK